jgi:hypothetical protein
LALQYTTETARWTTDTEPYNNAKRWPVETKNENESAIGIATGSLMNDTSQHLTTAALAPSLFTSQSRRGSLVQFIVPVDFLRIITEIPRFL